MANKVYLSDQDCIGAARDIAAKLCERSDIKDIKGLAVVLNGGMIPAYWLRKLLSFEGHDLPLCFVDVRSYENYTQQGELRAVSLPDLGDGAGWIVVDEVCDTGNTFSYLRTKYPKALYVSLTVKTKGKALVDLYGLEFEQEQWLVFPWELEDD